VTTVDVVQIVGLMARRLDAVHPAMLPIVVVLLVAIAAAAVPLTAVGGVLVCLRRALIWAVAYQPRKAVTT
jgi:hypothetical protein